MKLYRYTSNVYALFDDEGVFLPFPEVTEPKVTLSTHNVIRETKHCYFIRDPKSGKEKRILKDAKSTYAYDTKAKALNNYKYRCSSNLGHCRRNLDVAQAFYDNSKTLTVETFAL